MLSALGGEPIVVEKFEASTADGVARGLVATVDLADARVEPVVDGKLAHATDPKAEARLEATDVWAKRLDVTLAINANYFGVLNQSAVDKAVHRYTKDAEADIVGLSVSDGMVISPAREFEGLGDPALVITRDRHARVGRVASAEVRDAWMAVAGVGKSETDSTAGTPLVEHGMNHGATARIEPTKRHPRTVVGVDAAGTKLIILVIDGRQKDWSVGATLPEAAGWMIERGATDAVNLDGGGSSALVFRPAGGAAMQNKPSDGSFRPVANHLGFRLRAAAGKPGAAKPADDRSVPPAGGNQEPTRGG